jgi:DNA-binding transcriptional MerR regulator
MEYTVQKLARLAGVTPRTLRYYDKLGLLNPARISGNGYRIYGRSEVDRLQQILFFRELGVGLEQIREMLVSPTFDGVAALREHRAKLMEKRAQLDQLIHNVDRSIAAADGGCEMSDKEKFEGFKREMIAENERKYGQEARTQYGEAVVERSNRRLMNMSKQEMDRQTAMAEEIHALLSKAMDDGDPAGEVAQQAAALHGEWLGAYWPEYDPEAHANLARMYVEDERFKQYYDSRRPGAAEFLRDAVLVYTGL